MDLTTKELTAIEEQLGQEQLMIQKFKMYAEMTQDQQLKTTCEQISVHRSWKGRFPAFLFKGHHMRPTLYGSQFLS